MQQGRWEYLDKLANDMLDNREHKLFWNYVQSRPKGSNDFIVIKMENGNVLTKVGGIAECMNEYFASVFTSENFDNFPSFYQVIKDKDLSPLQRSPKDVSKILSELKPSKSPGPDSKHPMILKKCAGTLANHSVMFLMRLLHQACYHTTGNCLTLLLSIRKVLKRSKELSPSLTNISGVQSV